MRNSASFSSSHHNSDKPEANIYLFVGNDPLAKIDPDYQVTCVPKESQVEEKLEREGLDHECTQVVLLDGTLVTPIIVK